MLLLLGAVVYLVVVIYWMGKSLPGQALRTRGDHVRFQDGNAVYNYDAQIDPDDALPGEEEEDQDSEVDGPIDPLEAIQRGRLTPKEILEQLASIRAVTTAPPVPAATVDREALEEANAHARTVKMLPDDGRQRKLRCVGWRATSGCSPFGPRDPVNDAPCSHNIPMGRSGYCEVQDKDSGELFRVMFVHCETLHPDARFRCFEAWDFANFHLQATDVVRAQVNAVVSRPTAAEKQGILMVVYPGLIPSAYATVRALRGMGCTLPIEIWFRRDELGADMHQQRVLLHLNADFGPVTLRSIDLEGAATDLEKKQVPRAKGFATKIHAISRSQFEQVLFLDADNAPAKDPTFLFSTPEFVDTGALFWPDFWHPGHTIFNVKAKSLLWELLNLRFIRMFEQESGQILIDTARHAESLALVSFYTFHRPNHLERLRLVWGDKDLFRLAWLKSRAPFHMVQTPPALAGVIVNGSEFCGLTMVQHSPDGEVLFLHRNARKLMGIEQKQKKKNEAKEREKRRREALARRGIPVQVIDEKEEDEEDEEIKPPDFPSAPDGLPDPVIWTHLLSFNGSRTLDYMIDTYKVEPFLPQWQSCYGQQHPDEAPHFRLDQVRELPFADLENKLRKYAYEAALMIDEK